MADFEPKDARRPTRTLETLDNGDLGLYRVRLLAELGPTGSVDAAVMIPAKPADPDDPGNTDADYWKQSGKILHGVMNGLPSLDTIPSATQCIVIHYYGRWIVIIPECA